MSNYNNQQVPFWEFIRAFSSHGAGVDRPASFQNFGPHPHEHYAAFPFAGPEFSRGPPGFGPEHFGRGGRRGACRREHSREGPHGPPGGVENEENAEGEAGEELPHGPRGGFGRHRGRGCGHRRGHRGPPPSNNAGGFDLSALIDALSAHPLAHAFRQFAEQAAGQSGETLVPENTDDDNSFIPPVDVFTTETQFVLHVALPGAKKEDVGINWDAEKGVLNLAGVVYRPGDEEFLKTLSASERKVGAFERAVKLPPGNADKDEIDGDAITAKLEDGVLVITVPKVEKEWTEVKRVDIE